jgi:ribosomal protein L34E
MQFASPYLFALAMFESTPVTARIRVRVFVDFWNFVLSARRIDPKFMVDWKPLGQLLALEAAKLIDAAATPCFEGMHVYGSFDPAKPQDSKLRNWFANTLDKMPGVNTVLLERQRKKSYAACPECQMEMRSCASCGADLRGTEEKGVDTRMVIDLMSLACDAAVLVSADRDFVPLAEFLQTRGVKLVHGAFPPRGNHLSQKCWGHLNLVKLMPSFRRTTSSDAGSLAKQ